MASQLAPSDLMSCMPVTRCSSHGSPSMFFSRHVILCVFLCFTMALRSGDCCQAVNPVCSSIMDMQTCYSKVAAYVYCSNIIHPIAMSPSPYTVIQSDDHQFSYRSEPMLTENLVCHTVQSQMPLYTKPVPGIAFVACRCSRCRGEVLESRS